VDGSVQIVATGLSIPNGIGLLPDGTLVLNETRGSRIYAFTVESDGRLGTPCVFADLGPNRQPDGLCVDAEGGVWSAASAPASSSASWQAAQSLIGSRSKHGWAIAPALGGADGRTLYMVIDDTTIEGLGRGESTGWINAGASRRTRSGVALDSGSGGIECRFDLRPCAAHDFGDGE
jgi:sugar lactone lactonase YvrE